MKSNLNPLAIGMFVLTASVLAVAAIIIFGSFKFFTNTEKFITFFSESVNGLDVGAAVKYKGVKIGKVEEIRIGPSSKESNESSVIVIYSIDFDILRRKAPRSANIDFDEWMGIQITEGLRAKLNYQSIVTGMLYIELDYLVPQNTPYAHYYIGLEYKEIPSAKSGLAELAKSMEKTLTEISEIDFKQISDNANRLLASLNAKVEALDTKGISDGALAALGNFDSLLKDPNLTSALKNLDSLFDEARAFVADTRESINSVADSGKKTLSHVDSVLINVNTMVAPQSPMRYELAMLLRALNESVNSVSNLVEYLERNPSSILTGKSDTKNNND